jgi:uncharacterized delta-60 repeat protein
MIFEIESLRARRLLRICGWLAVGGVVCAVVVAGLLGVAFGASAGSFDPVFGSGGLVQLQLGQNVAVPRSYATAVLAQGDNKILLGGVAGDSGSDADEFMVARLNPDGTRDTTFGSAGAFYAQMSNQVATQSREPLSEVRALALQGNGDIIAAGEATNDSGGGQFALVRLLPTGALDTSFGSQGKVIVQPGSAVSSGIAGAYAVALQSDGKIVTAGWADDSGGHPAFAILRLNSDGSLDQSFGSGGQIVVQLGQSPTSPYSYAQSLVIEPDRTIAVAGIANDVSGNYEFALARLNANGSPYAGLGPVGQVRVQVAAAQQSPQSGAYGLALQSNGRLVAGGYARDPGSDARAPYELALARFNPDGTLDSSFGSGGKVRVQTATGDAPYSYAAALALQSDDKIVVAGASGPNPANGAPTYGFLAARFNTEGTLDTTFGSGGTVSVQMGSQDHSLPPWSYARAVAFQADGRILAAGLGTYPNSSKQIGVIRLYGARAPAASFSSAPSSPRTGDPLSFDASGSSDPYAPIVSYSWSFGDGATATGASTSHSYAAAGRHKVTLSVTDTNGLHDTVSDTVAVTDRPPIASFAFSPSSPQAGQAVSFDGSASGDPDGTILGYRWDFGDGSTAAGGAPQHVYAAPGSYAVILAVDDNSGSTANVTRIVTVADRRPSSSASNPTGLSPPDGLFGPFSWVPRLLAPEGSGPAFSFSTPRSVSWSQLRHNGLIVRVHCAAACAVRAALVPTAHTGRHRAVLARGHGRLRAPGRLTVLVRTTGARLSRLDGRHVSLTLRVRVSDVYGRTRTRTRRLALRP